MTRASANIGYLAAAVVILAGLPSASRAADVEDAGDVVSVLLPLAGIGTALVRHDREGQVQFLESFATNAVVTAGLKRAVNKTRPDGDCCNSFPSSHTSFAFMGASFLQRRYGRKFAIPAYAAAVFVGYSRVAADRHYVEDVLAGAAIGYASSYFFTTKYDGLTVSPVAGRDFTGVAISKVW